MYVSVIEMNLHLQRRLHEVRIEPRFFAHLTSTWVRYLCRMDAAVEEGRGPLYVAMPNLCPALLKSWWWSCNLKVLAPPTVTHITLQSAKRASTKFLRYTLQIALKYLKSLTWETKQWDFWGDFCRLWNSRKTVSTSVAKYYRESNNRT